MIITIGFANIHHIDTIKRQEKLFFSLRTLRIYSLNHFPMYHATVVTTVIMLYITSPVLIYLITGNLHPASPPPSSDSLYPAASGNHV